MEKIVVEINKNLEPIFGSFLANHQKDVDLLKNTITNSNYNSIKSIGHKLANNTNSYKLPNLKKISTQLEQSAIDNDITAIKKDYKKYCDYLNNLEIKFV